MLRFAAAIVTFAVSVLILAGCASSREISGSELEALKNRQGLGHLYYMGADSEYHNFLSRYFLERAKEYRVRRGEIVMAKSFAVTADKSEWRRYVIDLNSGDEGFVPVDPPDIDGSE